MLVLGLGTTINGYRMIFKGNVKSHRKWMIRSYAIALAGLTFGLCLFLSVVLGVEFEEIYPALAWVCWVPNLLIVELYFWFQTQNIGMHVKPGRTSS